ncbi:MAG: undecaprenyldiphospho-muramoylpentapeptide beta-N-acetylglucosaminyltransferase [Firmicutes bacterium]|nr:undecaprenyldiphospho-muramoylpentapeptide beta-N-acetylglucosaminyltransferase [Bacillota bacterium]MDD7734666.1 undecaprenyldiphospho-muramoylpentapeptide beta-N-acetylglucosaminyltransferase [Bacillota bacterium]
MKVIMTGGGTGGHIYPAIAIADEIKSRHPDAEIIFVGTERGMEKDIVPKAGYPIKFITVSGLNRKNPIKLIKTLKDLNHGLHEAKQIIKEFKPDLVIGTGGYVCGPVMKTAAGMGIKTYIHEQNAFPGLTNKLLSRGAERVFVAFDDAKKYFKTKKEPVTVGNPVRHAFTEVDRQAARESLGVKEDEFMVLSFGGSLGAQRINDEMTVAAERLRDRAGLRIFFVTGRRYYSSIMENADKTNARVTYLQYIDDMPKYLNACDLAITRSGALTVSEITACGRASVMIPSPYVTNNHQYYNAKVVADRGGAILIEEKDLTNGEVADEIEQLMNDRQILEKMEKASAALGTVTSAGKICDIIGI